MHPRKGEDGIEAIQKAAAETLKYAVKPADMTTDPEWFMELTRQVHKLRFVATGGALKNVLKEGQESDEELALTDGDGEPDDGGVSGLTGVLLTGNIAVIVRLTRNHQSSFMTIDRAILKIFRRWRAHDKSTFYGDGR